MRLGQITFLSVHASDLNDNLYRALWELSSCRNEDLCCSFLVDVEYFKTYLEDLASDVTNGHVAKPLDDEIKALHAHVVESGHKALFIINDTIFENAIARQE